MARESNLSLDVPYTWGFYGDQGPVTLNFVAALNGFRPVDLDAGFTYLELGSGNGVTVNTLAAALPTGTFHAIDIVPEHVANGRAMAAEAGLTNVTHHEADLASIDRGALPDFDFVTAHGLYSWITPEQRGAVVDLLAAKVKPGGLVYLGYNAMPGWAALLPLRRLLQDYVAEAQGTALERVSAATEKLAIQTMVGLEYFTANPTAVAAVSEMAKLDPVYVLHEYFNFAFQPQYFADVAEDMARAELNFVGLTQVDLNFSDFAVPETARQYMPNLDSRVALEQVRDVARNQKFRGDVFARAAPLPNENDALDALTAMRYGTERPAVAFEANAKLHCGGIEYRAPIFEAMIRLFDDGARTLAALWDEPTLTQFDRGEIFDGLRLLAASGAVRPFRLATQGQPGAFEGRLQAAGAFNRSALADRLFKDRALTLCSPVVGGGVVLAGPDAVLLAGLVDSGPSGAVSRGWSLFAAEDIDLVINEVGVHDEASWTSWATKRLEEMLAHDVAKWIELQIVEPAS